MRPTHSPRSQSPLRRAAGFYLSAVFLVAILVNHSFLAAADTQVASPDNSIQFRVTFKGDLGYEVTFKDKNVIEPSRLIFSLDGSELTSHAAAGEIKTYGINEVYPWRGAHSQAVNHCN